MNTTKKYYIICIGDDAYLCRGYTSTKMLSYAVRYRTRGEAKKALIFAKTIIRSQCVLHVEELKITISHVRDIVEKGNDTPTQRSRYSYFLYAGNNYINIVNQKVSYVGIEKVSLIRKLSTAQQLRDKVQQNCSEQVKIGTHYIDYKLV